MQECAVRSARYAERASRKVFLDCQRSLLATSDREEGFEPPLPGPEPGVLPLDDSRMHKELGLRDTIEGASLPFAFVLKTQWTRRASNPQRPG